MQLSVAQFQIKQLTISFSLDTASARREHSSISPLRVTAINITWIRLPFCITIIGTVVLPLLVEEEELPSLLRVTSPQEKESTTADPTPSTQTTVGTAMENVRGARQQVEKSPNSSHSSIITTTTVMPTIIPITSTIIPTITNPWEEEILPLLIQLSVTLAMENVLSIRQSIRWH